jgi:hypothetical protein
MQKPHSPPCETSHIKKLKTHTMIRIKLKTLEFQNTKTKNPQSSQEENQIPSLPPCETSKKLIIIPQNDKKKIEDFKTSK